MGMFAGDATIGQQLGKFLHLWNSVNNIKSLSIHKQLEMHGFLLSTVATDVLLLKHQAINIHCADQLFIVLDQFHTEILKL